MTDKTIIEDLKRKNWTGEDWKTSKDPIDRLVYFISYLSPHNLWRAREAVQQQLTLAEKRGRKEAIAEAHQRDLKIEAEHTSWIIEHDKQVEKRGEEKARKQVFDYLYSKRFDHPEYESLWLDLENSLNQSQERKE